MSVVEPVVEATAITTLGEGPRWFHGALWWVDVHGGALHRLRDGAAEVVATYPDTLSFVLPRARGGLVLGIGSQVVLAGPDGSVERVLVTLGDPELRCNDAECDPDGGLHVGTMRRDGEGREGRLVRVGPDGRVEVLVEGLGIANGLAFDPVRGVAYFVDSRDEAVSRVDLARGWRSRRPWVRIPVAEGLPDGLTLDADGAVWVALYAGGQVRRHLPDGTLDRVVEVPTGQTTSCAFGGPSLEDLYVTTGRERLGPDELRAEPLAGRLFRVRRAGRGLPTSAFAPSGGV